MALLFFTLIVLFFAFGASKPNYCLPTDTSCWPTQIEIDEFQSSLNGQLVTPSDTELYASYVNMTRDLLYTAYPPFVIVCLSAQDIQTAVSFASSHNIQISICSTGHSYSGRNTANNSVQINLSKMQKYTIADDANTITVETGLHWAQIYAIVDQVHRIVIGGSDPDVGPGGFSMGGGHSPISPHYGLSCDFTTEYYMVDAQANIVHVYNTSGKNQTIDDLFWSLKGGGGSTFGIIINITFLLHTPDEPVKENIFTEVVCTYDFYQYPITRKNYIADYILKNLFNLLRTNQLDDNWGGYILKSDFPVQYFLIAWNFYGNSSYAIENAQPFMHLNYPYNTSGNTGCSINTYDTFWEFESNTAVAAGGYQYLFNSLVPKNNLTDNYAQLMVEYFNASNLYTDGFLTGLCAVLQGGKVNERDDDYTSVNPAFRHNYMEMAFGSYWTVNNETIEKKAIDTVNIYEPKLREYGLGIYGNEENSVCIDCDWKQQFWGKNYDKLLNVKNKWDPNQVFWCTHCVGSDQ